MSEILPRLRYAHRHQAEFRCESVDQLLPPEHPARTVWDFVVGLDIGPLLDEIEALPGRAGAPAFDPRILLAVWLYATIASVGSSRKLEELCQNHLVFRWLCGDMAISYRTLSGFRTGRGEYLSQVLTDSLATLMQAGVVELNQVAQDGMRVRAAAGASSFRRGETIERCLEEAKAQVELLQPQVDEDAGAADRRSQAAQRRAAAERVERLEAAKEELNKLRATNAARPPSGRVDEETLRVSTTDPEARKMKMADGGFRPAFNVQFATEVATGLIVGVAVTNAGTDANEMVPMVAQIVERLDEKPKEMLVDGGYSNLEAIDEVQSGGTVVFVPIREEKKQLDAGKDPYAAKKNDTPQTAEWRARMGTPEAKEKYKLRASTAEWVNAQVRNRGMYQVRVRGIAKVLTVTLWQVLAHNFGRILIHGSACPGEGTRIGK